MRVAPSIAAVLLLASGGCLGPVTPQQLQRRYADATRMPPGAPRDQQFKWVALDATDAGNVAVAERAVRGIEDPRLRDDAAGASAARFVPLNAPDFAARMATLIEDPSRRDRALDAILKPTKKQ